MPAERQSTQRDRAVRLGQRLRQRRRELRLTQREVAGHIPMSAGNLSRIENGDQGPPSDEVIDKLGEALELPSEELLALAGRGISRPAFEQRVLRELHAVREEIQTGFERLERVLADR